MNFESFVLAASLADLEAAPDAKPYADAVEFRMDLATDPLEQLRAYDGSLPVLATNRVVSEGGEAPPGRARIELLREATRVPEVEAVDVELATVEDGGRAVLDAAADAGVATVVSTHDFEGTPPRDRLRDRLEAACEYGTVGKLACTATDRRDVLSVLSVTDELARSGRLPSTMAMGAPGRHSRVLAPLYGSVLGYAPVDAAEGTAPGQYDLATFSELLDDLS